MNTICVALSKAQLAVLCTMFAHKCRVAFRTYAAKGCYWNYRGTIEAEPTPRRAVMLALKRRGLVKHYTLARREIFFVTGKGQDFMMQRKGADMSTKLLTKREIQAILLAHYAAFILGKQQPHGFSIEVWQQKPRTDVKVCVNWRGIKFCDVGFASMNYKDTWDAEYGVRMAIRKAIAGIAKQIAYGQKPSARFEVLVPPLSLIHI